MLLFDLFVQVVFAKFPDYGEDRFSADRKIDRKFVVRRIKTLADNKSLVSKSIVDFSLFKTTEVIHCSEMRPEGRILKETEFLRVQ